MRGRPARQATSTVERKGMSNIERCFIEEKGQLGARKTFNPPRIEDVPRGHGWDKGTAKAGCSRSDSEPRREQ
jgi:hypothetical protein